MYALDDIRYMFDNDVRFLNNLGKFMPAKDLFRCSKKALIKDGWTITDDPLHLRISLKLICF